jgi:predicted RNase H-like nuclease
MSGFVAGVDGCPGGWAVVLAHRAGAVPPRLLRVERFAEILALPEAPEIVAVDMPIGLPQRVGTGGRDTERAVRPLLGMRQSSVFSVPSRAAVTESGEDYALACRLARETSDPPRAVAKQCFHLFPKIREIDALMTPALEARVYEVHPEVAFWRLAGGRAMSLPKKVKGSPNPAGLAERTKLLTALGFPEALFIKPRPRLVGWDDAVDAAAGAAIALRVARGEARPFPDPPPRDGRGLRMAIWA